MLKKFPSTVKRELEAASNLKINRLRQESETEMKSLRNDSNSIKMSLENSKSNKPLSLMHFVTGGFGVGLVGGALVCFAKGNEIDAAINFSSSLGAAFSLWFAFGIVGLVLGLLLYGVYTYFLNKYNNGIDEKARLADKSLEEQIEVLRNRCEEQIAKIRKNEEDEYLKYLEKFNNEAQKMSVVFADKTVVIALAQKITEGFCRKIDEADRRSHIKDIIIPIGFNVRKNCIEVAFSIDLQKQNQTSDFEVYDFDINRFEELRSPLEQTAVARAVASAVQVEIMTKYPTDVCGSNVVTETFYNYGDDFVTAIISYSAKNLNYKERIGWTD